LTRGIGIGYDKYKMAYPQNIYRNMLVVLGVKAGMTFYQITKAFGKKDKRNFINIYKRDCNKYLLKVGKDNKIILVIK